MNKEDILELMDRLDGSSLTELKVKDGDFEITIKKAGAEPRIAYSPPTDAATASAGAKAAAVPHSDEYEVITAPIVGTFYRSPSPDSPTFADEGSEVEAGDTLCIIEAMKVMNELEAEFPCRIHRVLVENQQMVEYGAPLFEVERLS